MLATLLPRSYQATCVWVRWEKEEIKRRKTKTALDRSLEKARAT